MYDLQTQGKIERWYQTLRNRILLEHYLLPGDLSASIERFVEHYNHHRYPPAGRRYLQRREAGRPQQPNPPQMSTSGAAKQSYSNAKISNETHSNNGGCNTANMLLKINQMMSQYLA